MKILDILTAPWMIDWQSHAEMVNLYRTRFNGEKSDFGDMAKMFHDSNNHNRNSIELDIRGGVSVIEIDGPMTPKSSFFSFFFGGVSMEEIRQKLILSDDSAEVKEKLFIITSPGGTVEGAFETSKAVFESNKIKPITTFTTGMIASAAYLIAAPTDKILISSETNQIGSIGVISTKADFTKFDANFGIEFKNYVSGSHKDLFSPDRKIDTFVDKAIQATVDYLATLFIENVAPLRKLSTKVVAGLEAKLLIGQQAIDFGLVDSISTIDQILSGEVSTSEANEPQNPNENSSAENHLENPNENSSAENQTETLNITTKNEEIMDRKELEEKHPDLFKSLVKEGASSVDVNAAIETDRQRATKIKTMGFSGQEGLITELINSGASVEEAAVRLNTQEQQTRQDFAANLGKDAIDPIDMDSNADDPPLIADESEKDLTYEQQWKAMGKAEQAEWGNDIENFTHYHEAVAGGRVNKRLLAFVEHVDSVS